MPGRTVSRRVVKSAALPPPTGGWDASTAIADMKPDRAVVLDNFFPAESKVTMRRGYSAHATGMTGAVESVMTYSPLSGTQKMFAAADNKIYDVTAAGAVGSADLSTLANNRWDYVNFGTTGGYFLFACNGADTPRVYNGSAWANTTLTGPTVTAVVWANSFKSRLFIGTTGSLSFWYGTAGAITGAFTEFPLSSVAKLGGYIVAMGTWTRDGGAGQDDMAVFVTSRGEVIIYQGVDPSDAASWGLIGVFRVSPPIGRRCLVQAGADLILLTETGYLPLTRVLDLDRAQQGTRAISEQINGAVTDAMALYGSNFGWQAFLYPRGTMLMFNVPTSATTAEQHVFNADTGAPCRFTGIPARCWGLFNERPYFGAHTGGTVYRFDTGSADAGMLIRADAVPAFNYFDQRGAVKQFHMADVVLENASGLKPALELNLDFNVRPNYADSSSSSQAGALWDTAIWDVDVWGGANEVGRGWRSIVGIGRAASLRVKITSKDVTPSWLATNFVYSIGGPLR